MTEFEDYLQEQLKERLVSHLCCPTCAAPLLARCSHADHDGAWCPLCGYHRDTLLQGSGIETEGRTEPSVIRGLAAL